MSDPGAKLKVAFVGCGNIAKYHLAAALKTGRVAVTVLVDPNPEGRAMLLAELERLRAAAGSGEHGSADADADSSAPAPPLEFRCRPVSAAQPRAWLEAVARLARLVGLAGVVCRPASFTRRPALAPALTRHAALATLRHTRTRAHRWPWHSSLQEAIDADPNQELFTAVDIMVPSFVVGGQDLHNVVATTAINGHRHVLLEKPVCIHPATAERLRQHHKASILVQPCGKHRAHCFVVFSEPRPCLH